jgi:hypothetical protein
MLIGLTRFARGTGYAQVLGSIPYQAASELRRPACTFEG